MHGRRLALQSVELFKCQILSDDVFAAYGVDRAIPLRHGWIPGDQCSVHGSLVEIQSLPCCATFPASQPSPHARAGRGWSLQPLPQPCEMLCIVGMCTACARVHASPNRIERHTRGLKVPSVSKARQILLLASSSSRLPTGSNQQYLHPSRTREFPRHNTKSSWSGSPVVVVVSVDGQQIEVPWHIIPRRHLQWTVQVEKISEIVHAQGKTMATWTLNHWERCLRKSSTMFSAVTNLDTWLARSFCGALWRLVHCGVAWRRCGPCSVFTMSATPGQSRPEGCRSFCMWDIVRCSIGESAGRLLRSPFSESKWNEDFAEV